MLREAFRHHAWANDRLLELCEALPDDGLTRHVPAIYGSVLETARHLVGADNWYLVGISGDELGRPDLDEDELPITDLRPIASSTADGWEVLLTRDLDPDDVVSITRLDGSVKHATLGIRLAQVLHHGSDHRSQICTALTTLGHAPPEFDVWAYGETVDLVRNEPPLV